MNVRRLRALACYCVLLLAACSPLVESSADQPATVPAGLDERIQVAVATVLVQERNAAEANAWREAWRRAGREFFRTQTEAERLAGGYSDLLQRVHLKQLPLPTGYRARAVELDTAYGRLDDRLYLLPLPSTPEGELVRRDIARAHGELTVLRNLTQAALASTHPDSEELQPRATSAYTRCMTYWKSAGERMLLTLGSFGIDAAPLRSSVAPVAITI